MTLILEDADHKVPVHYIALDPEPVKRYLAARPHITALLSEAREPLEKAFGHNARVSLTVTKHPESAEGEYLVSRIETSLPPKQASATLDVFDDTWWLANAPRAEGQLLFTVTFR